MTAKQMIELIGELSVNLKSVTDNNKELSEAERKYLYGISVGLKLATDTIRTAIERENDICKSIIALSSKSIKPDLGDYPDAVHNQFDNMTGSMNI